jgi:hypothetical protein
MSFLVDERESLLEISVKVDERVKSLVVVGTFEGSVSEIIELQAKSEAVMTKISLTFVER